MSLSVSIKFNIIGVPELLMDTAIVNMESL